MSKDPIAGDADAIEDVVRDEQLGLGILAGSSGFAGTLCAALLVANWPPSPLKLDPVEQVRRLQLGPSDTIHPGGPGALAMSWDRLLPGDVQAMGLYAKVEPNGLAHAGYRRPRSPAPGSWGAGAGRHEHHQDFFTYVHEQRERRDPGRRVLVLRWVGPRSHQHRALIPEITRFLTVYFQRPVRWDEPLALPRHHRLRVDGSRQHRQYPAGPILSRLRQDRPPDALAAVGITASDIYPVASWQFVFGLADLEDRVAVVSLHRLQPERPGKMSDPGAGKSLALRIFRLLAHEIGHTMGAHHCVAFHCLMNGCNSLAEHDATPLHLCPICLAKLAWRLSWDVTARYEGLSRLLVSQGHLGEARWFQTQLARLTFGVEPLRPDSASQGVPSADPRGPLGVRARSGIR